MRVAMGKTRHRDKTIAMARISLYNKAIMIEVTTDVHRLVKERAALRNIPMRQWVTRAIINMLKKELELQ